MPTSLRKPVQHFIVTDSIFDDCVLNMKLTTIDPDYVTPLFSEGQLIVLGDDLFDPKLLPVYQE